MLYDKLSKEATHHGLDIYEVPMEKKLKGLYGENTVWINRNIYTRAEKACVLAEELGHHFTTVGNVLDQSLVNNRKQEKRARSWAYEKLVPLSKIVQAHQRGIRSQYEFAEALGVTEEFLQSAINRYREKYGLYKKLHRYTICFEPLGVIEMFE